MGQSIVGEFIGLATGHCYIYLKDVLPQAQGKDYLKTPGIL